MDNFMLFVCGLSVALISAMGVLVYMVSLGYKKEVKPEIVIVIPPAEQQNKSLESFVGISTVSCPRLDPSLES